MVAAGVVTYSDSTVNSGSAPLDPYPRPCPQETAKPKTKGKR